MIDCRRDYPGLRIAAAEMFIESFLRKDLDEVLEGSLRESAIEALAKATPPRSVAYGYYQWMSYLMWLRAVTALPGSRIELMADEAEGLLVLDDAEREFRNQHPACPKCGALNEEAAWSCRKCQAEFKR
jgi:ribosomal protein S27AE